MIEDITAWKVYSPEMKKAALRTAEFRKWMHTADPWEFL